MKTATVWDAYCTLLKLTDVSKLRTTFIRAIMKAVRTSDMLICFNETTQRYIPDGVMFEVK
jgi:hypothetical protein